MGKQSKRKAPKQKTGGAAKRNPAPAKQKQEQEAESSSSPQELKVPQQATPASADDDETMDPVTATNNNDDEEELDDDDEEKIEETVVTQRSSFESIVPRLSTGVLQYLKFKNFHTMTPVQAATIPLFLTNKDVAVQAVTGSGKTLAFCIPVVELLLRRVTLLKKTQIGAIILSPTRELAHQTFAVAEEVCQYVSLPPPLLLVGGRGQVTDDLRRFAKEHNDVVVATPGRLEEIVTRYDTMDVSELECLVLDEADVLLDMGFEQTLSMILSKLPRMRRTGLFSATGTSHQATTNGGKSGGSIRQLMSRAGMRNPVWVNVAIASANQPILDEVAEQATPTSLSNYYLISPLDEKLTRLATFLRTHKDETIIVFFLTCACVDFFGNALQEILAQDENPIVVELLHGKLVQKRREKTMERFRDAKGGALFCTDVAARGLDVSRINWVVQYDAPKDPSSFVHRVGRSARAGRTGSSLLLLTPKEEAYVDLLQMRKVPLSPLSPETEECCLPSAAAVATTEETPEAGATVTEEQYVVRGASGKELPNMLEQVRDLCLKDRDYLEKGTKAFTSFIRAYKEHHCAFIFRFASMDLGLLAKSFCLLRLPKMPELRDKGVKLSNFTAAGPEVNIHGIGFKDKTRETARQKRLAAELAAGGKNAKQIKAEQRQAESIARQKEKRQGEIAKGRNPKKKRGRQAQIFDEWDDLAKEERLYKKLRNKKITEAQYKELMHGGDASNKNKASAKQNYDGSDSE